MTVRQTPLTATLSPIDNSGPSVEAMHRRKPAPVALRSINSPTDSTSPVNIPFDQYIRSERLDDCVVQRGCPERATGQKLDAFFAEPVRRDVQADNVDEILIPGRAVKRGSSFEHERRHLARRQALERSPERPVARHLDFGARALEGRSQFSTIGRL